MASARIFSAVAPTTANSGAPVFEAPDWTQITVFKITSGVVVLGTDANLLPVASGRGVQLPVDVAITFLIAKGTKLYIAANTSGEEVGFITQVVPNAAPANTSRL